MRLTPILTAVLVLSAFQSGAFSRTRLEGCPDPAVITNGFAKLSRMDWSDLTIARVREIWPVRLETLECEGEKVSVIGSKGRVIDGECECCQAFDFDVKQDLKGPSAERLANIIIKYSALRREDVVDVGKALARSAGLKKADVDSIGRESMHNFSWQDPSKKELMALDVQFIQRKRMWTVHVAFARYTIES